MQVLSDLLNIKLKEVSDHINRAIELYNQNDYFMAILSLNKAIDIDSHNHHFFNMRGFLL